MKYLVVIEKGANNYSAYVPDLPGCVSTGKTLGEVKRSIKEAVEFHIDGLREDGTEIPEPSSVGDYVGV
jgi:predicted RNase H-like HicB family nuclease